MPLAKKQRSRAGGRPPKFDEPRRVITVTLPERTLRQLTALEPDLARAIVKASDALSRGSNHKRPLVEVLKVATGTSVIVVGPSRCLREIPWLRLIEIAPARFLLTIVPGTAIESIEVAILDLLDGLSQDDDHERSILIELRRRIQTLRRDQAIWKAELLFVGGRKERFSP